MDEWLKTLVTVSVGMLGALIPNMLFEYWKHRKLAQRLSASIISEITVNIESARKVEGYSMLWVDDVYKANLSLIGSLKKPNPQKIVRFYTKVAQFKYRITYEKQQHEEELKFKKENSIISKEGLFLETVFALAKEIEILGNDILSET